MTLDDQMTDLVRKYGLGEVLASLCRIVNSRISMQPRCLFLFRKLNRVYEWWISK